MRDAFVFVGRRAVQLLVVIWVAGTVNFIVPRLIPGDPIETAFNAMALNGGQQAVDVAALKSVWNEKFGFDKPVITQYVNYWLAVSRGDLGISVTSYPEPVTAKIGAALPWSIGLLAISTIIAFLIGTVAGALLAWPSAPRAVRSLATPFLLLSAIPYYLLAIVLTFLLAVELNWLPAAGGFSPTLIVGWNMRSVVDIVQHAILPALSIVLGGIGFWALAMRGLMINVLGEDYISYAEAKGLSPRRVFLSYGLRNAILPQITALSVALGSVISGAVLVEAVFNYPGLGGLLYKAIIDKDIFVVNGVVLVLILTLAVALFVVDLLLPVLDPRIRFRR